jgi:hypothetical protein
MKDLKGTIVIFKHDFLFNALRKLTAEENAGILVSHSVNVKRMPLEMHHVNQLVGATRMAA